MTSWFLRQELETFSSSERAGLVMVPSCER